MSTEQKITTQPSQEMYKTYTQEIVSILNVLKESKRPKRKVK